MEVLIWINTLVLLLGFIVGGVIVIFQLRKISEALARVEETAARVAETAACGERLSLAILEGLPPSRESQA
jgi:uncharacterized protein YoxC